MRSAPWRVTSRSPNRREAATASANAVNAAAASAADAPCSLRRSTVLQFVAAASRPNAQNASSPSRSRRGVGRVSAPSPRRPGSATSDRVAASAATSPEVATTAKCASTGTPPAAAAVPATPPATRPSGWPACRPAQQPPPGAALELDALGVHGHVDDAVGHGHRGEGEREQRQARRERHGRQPRREQGEAEPQCRAAAAPADERRPVGRPRIAPASSPRIPTARVPGDRPRSDAIAGIRVDHAAGSQPATKKATVAARRDAWTRSVIEAGDRRSGP
jgi:hypothetical protein